MGTTDFSTPQRQSAIGVIVMFGDTLQKSVRAFVPIMIPVLVSSHKISKLTLLLITLGFLVLVAVIAYLKYRNFTFMLDDSKDEFIIDSGIWNKSRLAIPLAKIQQVNINQSLLQKIIGVHALEIDTAGSGGNEGIIKAVSHELAQALKIRLLDTEHKPDHGSATAEDESRPFLEVSMLSLLKTGITSNYARSFALLFAFFVTTFQYIDDFVKATGYDSNPLDDYINPALSLRFITFVIIGILLLILMINLVRTLFRYYGYKVTRQREALLLSYGLINTRNTIIRPDKVQTVTVSRNFFQKKLNIHDIRIRQASEMEASSRQQHQTAIEIPGCSASEKDELLKLLLEQLPQRGLAVKPNIRKLLLGMFISVLIPVATYYTLAYFLSAELWEYQLFVPVYVVFVGLLVYFGYRNSRLYVSKDFIIRQHGAWDVALDFIAPHRIQSLSLSQYFWQVSSNVGKAYIHTAGGTVSFGVANYNELKRLVNYWLYQIETTNKHWM